MLQWAFHAEHIFSLRGTPRFRGTQSGKRWCAQNCSLLRELLVHVA
jgi:hypothetical protein